ncbi:MAG: SCO7613 C-terminal domain-containing membrane protein [Nocardioides sp.]
MFRYADPHRCPDCHQRFYPTPASCPSCGLRLVGPDAAELYGVLQRADLLVGRLRAPLAERPAPPAEVTPERSPGHGGIRGLSVQRILLGLGALCLLVAALTFLVVAWSYLGVGGRTLVLLTFTAATAAAAWWTARRGLRTAAEAMAAVAFGLLALDVLGALTAGWFTDGDGTFSFTTLVGGGVVGAAAIASSLVSARWPEPLAAPQVVAGLGLLTTGVGLSVHLSSAYLAWTLTGAAGLGIAALARSLGLRVLPWSGLAIAGLASITLVVSGVVRAAADPSLRAVVLRGEAWPLLASGLMVASAAALTWLPRPVRYCAAAGGIAIGTIIALIPSLDEGATRGPAISASLLVAAASASALLPVTWRRLWWPSMALAALAPVYVLGHLGAAALRAGLGAGGPAPNPVWNRVWTEPATFRFPEVPTDTAPWLFVPCLLAILVAGGSIWALGGTADGGWRSLGRLATGPAAIGGAGVVALATWGTLALYRAPGAVVVIGLVVSAVGLAWGGRTNSRAARHALAMLGGPALWLLALLFALPSAWLTASVLGAGLVSAALAMRSTDTPVRAAGQVTAPVLVAALVWTLGEIGSLDEVWRAAPALALLAGIAYRTPRVTVESAAAASGAVAGFASAFSAADIAAGFAAYLTGAGALVAAHALIHPQRRAVGWAGAGLLIAATWVRLADLDIRTPEAYTLPCAIGLTVVGWWHLRRHPHVGTRTALGPGLVLATVPSLLMVMGEPASLRAALLGVACLALVLVGARLRWSASLVIGATVGLVLALRAAAPYSAVVPSWVLIGLAGTTLTVAGVTWEARLRNLASATDYLRRLR